jgi:hypothetical protein
MNEQNTITLGLIAEFVSEEAYAQVEADLQEREVQSFIGRVLASASAVLSKAELGHTRIVMTGDFVRSVEDRRDAAQAAEAYTVGRGAGVVAGKTMPPNDDGIVDIIFPIGFFMTEGITEEEAADRTPLLQHLAAHEAVHACLFHIGEEVFHPYRRESFDPALLQFIAMAGEQMEEYLAEAIANSSEDPCMTTGRAEVESTFAAWVETISSKLPAIDRQDPDYFRKGMQVSFEALHILWKTLAYLAAELRTAEGFREVPREITRLPQWRKVVDPWWRDYTQLLSRLPLSVNLDPEATDRLTKEMGQLLQDWALDIGFDYHDTDRGPWFRITLWD